MSVAHNAHDIPVPPAPLACRRCGAIAFPVISPGTGPHALKASCPDCDAFMRWMSRHSPEERARLQAQARLEAMAKLAPTVAQVQYLKTLGHTGPAPANRAEASQQIAQLRTARRGA